ncbi:MAG TPA: F0F1 ATP synthase subunit B [Acidimicrobiales bacterium]|nr:F0F1 ATP synthase subunit B [Acidimicrobiales bacterium]
MFATSNFLIPNATLIVEIVAFLFLLWFIRKVVLPPVNKALEERREQIRTALEQAEAARAEADESRVQRQAILDEARNQAREILSQANKTADRLRAEAQERGQLEYERIVASAEQEIVTARQRAIEEVSTQVAGLVLSVAQRVIGREVDAEGHRALIDEAVAALGASGEPSSTGAQA